MADLGLDDATQRGMATGFTGRLLAASIMGLAVLALRETRATGVLRALHLGAVMALLLAFPYGKVGHAV